MVGEEIGWVVGTSRHAQVDLRQSRSTRRRRRSRRWSTKSVASADITKPTKDPVPYIGIQYVAIPEFQGIGTTVGQQIAAALAGQVTVDQALQTAQRAAERTMKQAGYPEVS